MSSQSKVESSPTATDNADSVAFLIEEVLTDYLERREEAVAKALTSGDEVLSKWMAIKAQLKRTNLADGSLYNPLLQSIDLGETTHSALLGDLLNPEGSHGQDRLFLEAFLNLIGVPNPEEGKWVVTVEKGRIDILLLRLRPSSVIIIENKSNYADDQPNQLYRYWYQKIYKPYPKLDYRSEDTKHSFKIVYLPPDISKKLAEDSLKRPPEWAAMLLPERVPIEPHVLTFQLLMERWRVTRGQIPVKNTRLTTFLKFYSEIWQ